jgi:hypothetical protein
MQVTHKDFIAVYKGAFSDEFCDMAVSYTESMIDQGFGRSRQAHDGVDKTEKEDDAIFPTEEALIDLNATREIHREFMAVFWDSCYPDYSSKYDILKNSGKHKIYSTKLQRTKMGGGYHLWHCENNSREQAQRLLSFVLYLNDVEEGGETEFLYQHVRVKPKAGTLVVFPAAFTHVHRGNPPLTNTKYILTGWVEF